MAKSDEEETYLESETAGKSRNFHILRADNDLFNEAANVPLPVINVKRVKLKNGEDWEILEDGQVALTMKGTRFTNPEKVFLRTVDGMKFLIEQYKYGKKSVVKIKDELKRVLE